MYRVPGTVHCTTGYPGTRVSSFFYFFYRVGTSSLRRNGKLISMRRRCSCSRSQAAACCSSTSTCCRFPRLSPCWLQFPSFISVLQFVTSSVTAMVLMASGQVPVDRFEWRKVKPYCYYVAMFVTTIYCNMRALQHCNVETIIVFRSACPLIVINIMSKSKLKCD